MALIISIFAGGCLGALLIYGVISNIIKILIRSLMRNIITNNIVEV